MVLWGWVKPRGIVYVLFTNLKKIDISQYQSYAFDAKGDVGRGANYPLSLLTLKRKLKIPIFN